MKQLYYLVSRNISIFSKNKKNVLLSLSTIFIVFGLYTIFLRDFMIQSVEAHGLTSDVVREFTDRLMLSGLLIVVNTTTCFGMMQLCVQDYQCGIQKDYLVAPLRKTTLVFGYWTASVIISFSYTTVAFLGILIFCYVKYQMILPLIYILPCLLIILLSSVLNSELLLCIITFIKDTTTFSTFGNLYGMLSGFLAGTYLPYDLYPENLKKVLYYYPATQLTSLIRQLFLTGFHESLEVEHSNEICSALYHIYGVELYINQNQCDVKDQLLLIGFAFSILLLFLGLIHRERSI